MDTNVKRNRKILVIVGSTLVVVILILAIIVAIINSRKTATLHTIIAPSFAEIIINNKTYNVNQDIKLEPGEYTITLRAEDFQPQDQMVTLLDNETTTLAAYLSPDTGDTFSWYEIHGVEYSYFMSAANYLADLSADNYAAKYPIVNMLPATIVEVDPTTYAWTEYRISGGNFKDCKSDFCVKITDTTGGNREKALQKIRDNGFNPDDYQIIYEYTPVQPLN